jgi:hypothetical protein
LDLKGNTVFKDIDYSFDVLALISSATVTLLSAWEVCWCTNGGRRLR